MEGIIGGPYIGTDAQLPPSRQESAATHSVDGAMVNRSDPKRSPGKQTVVEHPVDDLMVNCREPEKIPVKPANKYKITEVDTGRRVTDLESSGNGSVPTHSGSLAPGVSESVRGQTKLAKQRKGMKTGVSASDSAENRWQKFFDKYPEYSTKDKQKLKPDLRKKLLSLEKKNKGEYWQPVVGKETSCDRVAMLLKVIRECEELFEALDSKHSNCPDNIKHYVKLLWVRFGLYHLDECLKSGLPDYQLSFMTGIKDKTEYLGFLHALAKQSVCGYRIVPVSRHIQFFCYYKAVDAGCEKAKILLIKEMLFCRVSGDNKDILECHLFCPREALSFLSTLSRRKTSADSQALSDYDQIIDWLLELLDKKDANIRDKLASKLITDERSEVKALVPMLFLEKSFGEIDPERALEFINELSEIPVLKCMHDYWLCRYYFADGKEKVEDLYKSSVFLIYNDMPSIFDIYLDFFLYHEWEKPFSVHFFNILYLQLIDSRFFLLRDLAHRMFVASYILDKMDCFEKSDLVSKVKKKLKAVSIIYGHPDAVANKLYDESRGFFSMDHWEQSGLGKRRSTPDGFLNAMEECYFSRDPVIGIFRKANDAITSSSFSINQNNADSSIAFEDGSPSEDSVINEESTENPDCTEVSTFQGSIADADIEWESAKTLFWLLVLNFLPRKDLGFADLVNMFLNNLKGDDGDIQYFFHRSSTGEFVRKLYGYHDFSNQLKDHPLFILENIKLFKLNDKDYDWCLKKLLTIKILNNCSSQIVSYMLDLSDDHRVIKTRLNEDDRLFFKVVLQERHPVGDIYVYKQLMSILERIENNNDVVFHVDMFVFLLGFVNNSKYCLDQVWIVNIFDSCLRIARRIKMMMYNVFKKHCRQLCKYIWSSSVVENHVQLRQLHQAIKSLRSIGTNLAESNQVNDYKINFSGCLLDNPGYCKNIIEHNMLSQIRSFDGGDKEFVKLIEKVSDSVSEGSVDRLSLADAFFTRCVSRKCIDFECLKVIAHGINGYFKKQLNLEFEMMLKLLQSMRESLDRSAGKPLEGTINIELQYYSLLAEMALRGSVVLARFFNESENDFFSQISVAISGNDDQIEAKLMEVTDAEGDIPRRLRIHSRASENTESVQGSMAKTDATTSDASSLDEGISTLPEGERADLNERACELISKKSQYPEIQSELLWIGYESAVLSKAQCLNQISNFSKESKEYFLYSAFLEDRADHPVFLSLKKNENLYLLKRPQLEAIGLNLVAVGRIKDAFWLAEAFNLNWLGGMLSWHHDKVNSFDETSNEILKMLIHGAEAGINMAHCRLVDWVLHQRKNALKDKELIDKDEQLVGEKTSAGVSVQSGCSGSFEYSITKGARTEAQCGFYIHVPCIWSDSQRILYQGVALCTGIHGGQDENTGIKEIKEALTSDDPGVPFILYWLQTSSLMEREYVSNESLLIDFARKMSTFNFPERLLTELVVNFGESVVARVASDMIEMTGTKKDDIELLQAQSKFIQEWLCKWQERVRVASRSPVEKLIDRFGSEAKEGWPVENHSALQNEVKKLSKTDLGSNGFQSALISAVKRVDHLWDTHNAFSGFLYSYIDFRNQHRLFTDEDGAKGLDLNAHVFERGEKLPVFRVIPKKQQQIILERFIEDIKLMHEQEKVDSNHIVVRFAEELEGEVKSKGIDLTPKALANHIRRASQEKQETLGIQGTGKKKYTFSRLLQFLCFIDSAGLKDQDPGKNEFCNQIKFRAFDSLNKTVDVSKEEEKELLSKIAIFILSSKRLADSN